MTIRYWTGSSTKHKLVYHLVLLPKYRRRVLIGEVGNRIRSLFYEACEINKWWIHEIEVMEDHVHVMLQIKPNDTLSKVVQVLKGGSSRYIRKEYPELEEFLWGDSFWSDGYFAETSGKMDERMLQRYIKTQRTEMTRSR